MTKNHRTTTTVLIAIAAVVAATLLTAGTVSIGSNHFAFAHREYKKDNNNYQRDDNKYPTDGSGRSSISIPTITSQDQECKAAGGTSPITGACIATSDNTIDNSGGINGK